MQRRFRVATLSVATLVSLAATAPGASAAIPGANGTISYTYNDYADTSSIKQVVTVAQSTDGSDVQRFAPPKQVDALRPTLSGPWGVTGPLITSADTRHVAINTAHREYGDQFGNIVWDKGAHVGSLDDFGGIFRNGPFFPDLVRGGDFCNGYVKLVAPLADGTFLWKRVIQDKGFQACNNSSRKEYVDYTITDTSAAALKRVFDSRDGKTLPGTVFGSSGEANTVYSWSNFGEIGIYKIDLAAQTSQRILTTLPFTPTDVSPDGRYAVGVTTSGTAQVKRLDLRTGEVVSLISATQADAVQPSDKVGSSGLGSPVFSPDGTKIAVFRINSTDKGGRDAILAMDLDGSSPRVVTQVQLKQFTEAQSLAWQPGPSFAVELSGDALIGDTVELDVKTTNLTDEPITGLTWTDGGVPGLRLNNAPFEQKLQPSLLGGPTPGLLTDLGAKASGSHQYLLGIDMPGRMFVRADVVGGPAGKAPSAVRSNVLTIDASTRALEQWEQFMRFSGGYTFMADLAQSRTNAAITDTLQQVQTMTKGFGAQGPAARKSRATVSALERGLARRLGLPDDTFKWMPNNTKEALVVHAAFVEAEKRALSKSVGTWAGAKADKVSYAASFWKNQVFGPDSRHIPVTDILYQAGAEKGAKYQGYVKQARDIVTGPDADIKMRVYLGQQTDKFLAGAELGYDKLTASASKNAKEFGRLVNDDPAAAADMMGGWIGSAEGATTTSFIDAAIEPSPANILKWGKQGGALLRKVGVPDIDFSVPSGSKLDDLVETVDDAVPANAEALGMGNKDQGTVARITKELEDEARGLGYDVDLDLSFRARNLYSAGIKDGVGKIGLFTTKSGTDLDVILGMDKRALGKGVIYRPRLPKDLDAYDDDFRHALIERQIEMLDEYRAYQKPGSAARKAATKNGTEYENKFLGVTTMKAQVKTREVRFGETIALKYEKLIVDGRTIVDAKKAGRWMISDFDGNALVKSKGKNIPAGVRGALELRLNRKLIAAAEKEGFAYGFHGFTVNGFDVEDDKYRKMVKYVLEGLDGPERQVMLDKYLKKYGVSDYSKLLESYQTGSYVIRVTRDGAEAATGF